MRRKFNYTGRKKIERNSVVITLDEKAGQDLSFDVKLNLEGYDLPLEAPVYLEAYDRSSYMRFKLGTVGDIQIPSERKLTEIHRADAISFRLKVVDESEKEGRILAIADNVITKQPLPKNCILPVGYVDLGNQIWQIDFFGETPVLNINNRLEDIGIYEILKNDTSFFSLVFPSVVKEILNYILLVQGITDIDGDEWQNSWLSYICNVCGAELPPEIEENPDTREIENCDSIFEWINEEALPVFCSVFDIRNYYEKGFGDSS